MTEKEIQDILLPIIGQFVWGVKQGYGSFLNLEFGKPITEFSRIHKPKGENKFPFNEFESRHVTIKGEHSFFICMSNWKIYAKGNILAHDESERDEIKFALGFINGQKLNSILINTKENITELEFDLGGILVISGKNYADEINEMWNFYTESEKVLTYRNDRKATYGKATTEYGKEEFSKVNGIITCPNKVYKT
ncbi:hypothetical protein [Croceivirga sp. JEA036]|uniref:hypothetical protein n=1 Tax=Croceivirga sp. JEA036 TaxID=2721162 RepID=UPI00143C7585|nr:hypothetical protein [Croceivirga sp. JEA036]NJB36627.1 hypothetical protein [Croceivirga sp. JEA036]